MPEIPLTRGKVAIVDEADFEYLSQWKWCCANTGYAVRRRRSAERPGSSLIYMHRVIAKVREDEQVDHANCNTLDNRRSNLRTCGSLQNAHNRRVRKDSVLGLKGVQAHQGGFRARIKLSGKNKCLGVHATPQEAHQAYAEAAALYFGEYARN